MEAWGALYKKTMKVYFVGYDILVTYLSITGQKCMLCVLCSQYYDSQTLSLQIDLNSILKVYRVYFPPIAS